MALVVPWTAVSPRDKAALDFALTQMAGRYLDYKASVEAISTAFAGVTAADLQTMGYDSTITAALLAAFGTISTHANDAGVFALMGHLRSVTR